MKIRMNSHAYVVYYLHGRTTAHGLLVARVGTVDGNLMKELNVSYVLIILQYSVKAHVSQRVIKCTLKTKKGAKKYGE